jgi:hypothetical protein
MPANIPLPSETADPIVLADWLELLALSVDDGNASHGDLQRTLNRLGVDGFDIICTACMRELHRRVAASESNYPFTFTGTLLARRGDWREYVPYVFCLLLSYCDEKKKRVKGTNHELMFEQLACLAARGYLGGEVLRFGFPRKDLPAGFHDAIREVCGTVKEWTPVAGKTLKRKDGGLDLVAWKPFPDQQIGKIILFGHCASGADWDAKINELQPNDFCSLWLGGDRSPIVKTFFIPRRLPPELFADRAVSAKLFFDRCRIARFVASDDFVQATGNASVAWCETVFPRLTA